MTTARKPDPAAETTTEPVPGPETTDVVLAYPWTDSKGGEHAPDETVSVSPDQARDLIRDGRARAVTTTTPKE